MSLAETCRKAGIACIALLVLQVLGAVPAHAVSHAGTEAAERQSSLAKVIVRLSLEYHYPAVKLDAELSRRVLSRYIDILDPGHFYFTQKDVQSIHAAFDSHLAKDLRTGNMEPAFAIHRFYLQRKKQLSSLALRLLSKKPELDSTVRYRIKRKDAPRPLDNSALEKLWQERIDNETLDQLLRGESLDSARTALKTRYASPGSGNDSSVFARYMNAFMSALDPHSRYVTARQAGNLVDGTDMTQVIAGARLINRNGYVTIVRPPVFSNAQKSNGLVNGGRILGIQMKPGGKTVHLSGWRLDKAINTIKQSAGTPARLLVQLPGPPGLQRTHWVHMPASATQPRTQRAGAYIDFVRAGTFQYKIGVIRIPSFYRGIESNLSPNAPGSVDSDVAYLIRLLKRKGVSALLLDMRNNTGGSLKEALALTSLFMPNDEPVVDIKTRFGNSWHFPLNRHIGITWRGPLGILVNRGSASATELFCGALKDYDRAIIMGTRTWGKGTIQTFIPLAGYTHVKSPGELKLTTAEFFRPDGDSPQLRGVLPDIKLPSASNVFLDGEAAYSNALPVSTVSPHRHARLSDNTIKALPLLQAYFNKDKDLAQNQNARLYERDIYLLGKTVNGPKSLNFKKRKHLLEESAAQWLKMDYAWRSALGEPQLNSLKQARQQEFNLPDVPLSLATQVMGKFADLEPSIGLEINTPDVSAQTPQCRYLPLLQNHPMNLCTPGSRQLYYAPPAYSSGKAGGRVPQLPDGGKL